MARPRTPPAPAPARELRVEPGPPPVVEPETDDERARAEAELAAVPPTAPQPASDLPEWKIAAVRALVVVPFLALHYTVGRGGPETIFIPDEVTRNEMAEPACDWLNESLRLRALARFGSAIAFLAIAVGFLFSETVELGRYRKRLAAGLSPTPDHDLPFGAGVREVRPQAPPPRRHAPAPIDEPEPERVDERVADEVAPGIHVRAWSPPRIPPDS